MFSIQKPKLIFHNTVQLSVCGVEGSLINISQDSAAKFMWCGGIFKHRIIAHLLQSVPVKEFRKSVKLHEVTIKICRLTFLDHSVHIKTNSKNTRHCRLPLGLLSTTSAARDCSFAVR